MVAVKILLHETIWLYYCFFFNFDAYFSGLPLLVVGLWSFLTYYLPDPYHLQPPSASAIPYSMDDSYYKKDDGTTGRWNSSTENIELVSNSYTAEQGKRNSLGRNVKLFIPILRRNVV